jgi:starch synthase
MAVSRAVELHAQPATWKRLQTNGMKADFSWGASGAAYAALYRQLIEEQG